MTACPSHAQTTIPNVYLRYSSTATDSDPGPPAPPPLPSTLPSTPTHRVSPPGKTGRAWPRSELLAEKTSHGSWPRSDLLTEKTSHGSWPRSDLIAEKTSHGSWPRSDLLAELKATNGTDSLRRSAGTGRVAPSTVYYGKPVGRKSQPSDMRSTGSTQVSRGPRIKAESIQERHQMCRVELCLCGCRIRHLL